MVALALRDIFKFLIQIGVGSLDKSAMLLLHFGGLIGGHRPLGLTV